MKVAAEWADAFCDGGDLPIGRGLAFIGKPGRGKTMIACAVVNEVHERRPEVRTGYTTYESYLKREHRIMQLEALLRKGEDADDLEDIRALIAGQIAMRNDTQVLLVDDVGKEHTTTSKYAEDEFDWLLRTRYDMGLTTIVTSNVPIMEWSARYSEAMESFAHEAFTIVKTSGRDYRK